MAVIDIGNGKKEFRISQDELIKGIADMDALYYHLLKLNPNMPEESVKDLKKDFEIADTAMRMMWVLAEKDPETEFNIIEEDVG